MLRPDFKNFIGSNQILVHSAKGSTWDDHKYVKVIDGVYYYPVGYEDGRTVNSLETKTDQKESKELSKKSTEELASLVIAGQFGNGEERKKALGDLYKDVQKRVNEILLKDQIGKQKVSEAPEESVKKTNNAASKVSDTKIHSGTDMKDVLKVYDRQDKRR